MSSLPKAFLVGIDNGAGDAPIDVEPSLEELGQLADSAGLEVVGQTRHRLRRPDPNTFIRRGKVEEIISWVHELGFSIVLFDMELLPRHQRNLENAFGSAVQVVDRTALILDIFARHARSHDGAVQVLLAQYVYRLPRLTRQWTHLVRQSGGATGRGGVGGVGLRGPGETQLETDRREVRRTIVHLQAELQKLDRNRSKTRTRRRAADIPVMAFVGYTNAGKSTLLNALAGANVHTADQLFSTLDPTTRRLRLSSRQQVLAIDTVGFINKLPHAVVAAFASTLSEVAGATFLIHVIDGSHQGALSQARIVETMLRDELGISDVPIIRAINKIDSVPNLSFNSGLAKLQSAFPDALLISATEGTGLNDLLAVISAQAEATLIRMSVSVPHSNWKVIARFHRLAQVESVAYDTTHVLLRGTLRRSVAMSFNQYAIKNKSA